VTGRPDSFMPFYVGDYLRDTMHLTTRQHGAYCLLLLRYWAKGGPLPIDEEQLRAITRLTPQEWKSDRGALLTFFTKADDGWHQKRADEELAEAVEAYNRRRIASEKGNAKRWRKDSLGRPNAIPMRSQPHLSSPKGKESVARGAAHVKAAAPPAATISDLSAHQPDWADDDEIWLNFKLSLTVRDWAVYFKPCRLNGSRTSLIVPGEFSRSTITDRWSEKLAELFGEPITMKVEKPQPKEAAQ
jgi:uncharacterized protein YdaU (DUF1376 family)